MSNSIERKADTSSTELRQQPKLSRRDLLRLSLSVPLVIGGSTATLAASADNLRQRQRIIRADEPTHYYLDADTGEREAHLDFDTKTMAQVHAKKGKAFNTIVRNFKVIFVSAPAAIAGLILLRKPPVSKTR